MAGTGEEQAVLPIPDQLNHLPGGGEGQRLPGRGGQRCAEIRTVANHESAEETLSYHADTEAGLEECY